MSFKFLGIEVERKTDVLAFAAFFISIGSLVTQGANLIQGPDVSLELPRQVLIHGDAYADGFTYTRISTKLVYLNTGSPGYDDVTRLEKASLSFGDRKITLIAQDYIESSVDENDKNKLIIDKKSDADPVQIRSGSVVIHDSYFAPWPDREGEIDGNYLVFSDFISIIEKLDEIKIEFTTTTFSGDVVAQSCNLIVSEFVQHLKDKGWSAPTCKSVG